MKIIKILLAIFLILILAILYLSIFGIKTDKFNNQINNNILKINKKIKLKLNDVKYLLNPYNFTINIKTKDPQILLGDRSLKIKEIQTNVALKNLYNSQFSIDDLEISTKKIKLNNIISFARIFENSPELFILDKFIKDGNAIATINLSFDKNGKIKKDYKIKGSVQRAKINILNKHNLKNLNFDFNIEENEFLLKQLDVKFNDMNLISPFINVNRKNDSFFVNGKISSNKIFLAKDELKLLFGNLFKDLNIEKIQFNSENTFSFEISKNFKFDNIKVESLVNLNELSLKKKVLELKKYLPNFADNIKLINHNIIIGYDKKIFKVAGKGNVLLKDKLDNLSYQITKGQNGLSFDFKIDLEKNSLLIDILNYKKKENSNSTILIKGNLGKINQLNFDLINLKEENNEITIKDLDFDKDFKIIDIENLNINLKNDKKIFNKIKLTKNNSNFILKGDIFDASKLIDRIMDNDDGSSSIFQNLNSKINIKIKKTYIDEINYINNLTGNINYKNNKINDLNLKANFPNKKKISLNIDTNKNSETITRLNSTYPKPLIKRYDFIKGFDEGYLDFVSKKKDGISKSILIIDNFKVKEVPIFAKLLSLASLQGVADLLTGEGIRFTDLEMKFSNQKGLLTIDEMYAIGPAVSILLDGYIQSEKLISLRGTLVPATTINRSIASIPFLGKILIGDKTGEGVFGVSFKIKGPPKDLKTSVNPIKSLTPRFITRTLEKLKKN